MKLWDKGVETNRFVEEYTVGKDRELDMYLAPYDVLGNMAHITMLQEVGLLEQDELNALLAELKNIYSEIQAGDFQIQEGIEDVHSQVEMLLTERLGDIGKKVHSGRSRNDQVLVDLKLYLRQELQEIVLLVQTLFELLIALSEKHKNALIPGYTHLQIAMPSSFGLWFGAYAESLSDDLFMLQSAYRVVNQNPLGSAAGYGSSFPLNRQLTTDLLGFANMNYNVVYAQMGRGKTEQVYGFALASLASTLSKMAMDMCVYNSQNFGFVSFPDAFTTGSSIMPHKKNPDVWELMRGKMNKIKALPNEVALLVSNLPSGYHRDLQLLKEQLIPAIEDMKNSLHMARLMLEQIQVKEDVLQDEKYQYVFSVEDVNKLVLSGVPFRDAYKQVGAAIAAGTYHPTKEVQHTHAGSLGNLCNAEIEQKFQKIVAEFDFSAVNKALQDLLQ